ncbi:MAG: TAXI family TRAP transporter solute-binding subunit, partial [Chromatiales bacterium]|nr:TAXI family TRAP transporter solute-binding subunit [Chromatiales bacterium]
KSMNDFKGKKVFLGPPAGAATTTATQIVRGATNLKPGEDFEVMRFDWKSAETAFLDRQMDVYIGPTSIPSPSIQQFALVSPIRILGIPDAAFDTAPMKKALSLPGRTIITIPPDVYDNQVNEKPVRSIGSWVGIGSHMDLDADVVYGMVKAFWEHLDEIHATAEWMKVITKETALQEMNIPLHAGAYRYYKEAGWNVRPGLIPPEAK